MAAADPIAMFNINQDLNTNDNWDANVSIPLPGPISIPDSSNILAELSMYTSAMSTPLPSTETNNTASTPTDDTDSALFRNGPNKTPRAKRRAPPVATPAPKPSKMSKVEHMFVTEPVTPNGRAKSAPFGVTKIAVAAPMSPTCQSLCTDEGDDVLSMPSTPVPGEACSLPMPSKENAARRRALRRAALKRNRSRKEDGVCSGAAVKSECTTKSETEVTSTGEPLDKKAARAIRNREAAMKSRVEAKEKMRKLQDENDKLAVKVKFLSDENAALTTQLKSLLQHTLGVQVAQGQDVKEVFNTFARMTSRPSASS